MPWFQYDAVQSDGTVLSGKMEADGVADVVAKLESAQLEIRGIGVIDATERSDAGDGRAEPSPEWRELEPYLGQLLEASRPLAPAIESFAGECLSRATRTRLLQLARQLESAQPAAEVFHEGRVIDPLVVSTLGASAAASVGSGRLAGILANLCQAVDIQRQIKKLCAYPLILLFLWMAIAAFVWVLVIPHFRQIYADFEIVLPVLTLVILNARPWILFMTGLLTLLLVAWSLRQHIASPRLRASIACRLPVLGHSFRNLALSRFARALAALRSTHAPLPPAIRIAGRGTLPGYFDSAVDNLAASVDGPRAPLPTSRRAFPAGLEYALSRVESTDAQVSLLRELAQDYESRTLASVRQCGRWYEPLFIILIGGAVGITVLALFLPLLSLVQNLSG